MLNYCGYFWGKFWKHLGYFLFQHLVTLVSTAIVSIFLNLILSNYSLNISQFSFYFITSYFLFQPFCASLETQETVVVFVVGEDPFPLMSRFCVTASVARCLDGFVIFGRLQQLKLANIIKFIAKVCSQFVQIPNIPSKFCPSH